MLCPTARVSKHVAYRLLRFRRPAISPSPYSTFTRDEPKTVDDTSRETKKRSRLQRLYPSTRTAYIRFWEPVHTIADVWTVKRAMEKKYGAILETYFLKDFEAPDRYQMIAYIIFRDLEALERIPETGEEFTVVAPEIPKKPIHEIGVKDIEAYAGGDEFQPGFQFDHPEKTTTKRILGGNIRRHPIEYASNIEHRNLFQAAARKTMGHFLNWGGFNSAKIDTSRQVYPLDLFTSSAREENARMRAALQICSRLAVSPIPQGVASTGTIEEAQTVPKPGPSLETARIFAGLYDTMPSSALGRLRKEAVDEDVGYSVGETVGSTSSGAPTSPFKAASSDTREHTLETTRPEPADSSPSPSSESSGTLPSTQPSKRSFISPEEKQKLESQLHAARLLQKAATPMRRKPSKPTLMDPARKPRKPQQQPLNAANAFVAEEKQEKRGFLAKLASLFGQ